MRQLWAIVRRETGAFFKSAMAPVVLAGFLMWTESIHQVRESSARLAQEAVLRAQAEAKALRAQFNPHFVLNTLHSLMALVREEPETAERAIEDVGALGDKIMLQNYYPEKDPSEIQKNFGTGFAESLMALTIGQWHGPVLSGYGVHLVYVSHIRESPKPVFAELRERVTEDWKIDRGEELNEVFYENLRGQYTVVIESPGEDEPAQSTEQAE